MVHHLTLAKLEFRWILLVAAGLLLKIPTACAGEDDVADRLLADYREYGLPRPSRNAELVMRKHGGSTVNGVPQYSYDLALQDQIEGKTVHWLGMFPEKPSGTVQQSTRAPAAELISKTVTGQTRRHQLGDEHTDLVLAIHCQDKGWKDLAAALLARSRKYAGDFWSERRTKRPSDDRAALALAAWDYWCEQFIREPGDRTPVLARLKALSKAKLGVDTAAHANLLEDMELTLAKSPKPSSELEEAINSLIDLGKDWDRDDWYPPSVESASRSHRGYGQLRDAGPDAVPVLVAHLDDNRLTRCIGYSRRGAWHARIADVAAQVLDELATQPFSYDLLVAKGRGKQLDRAHVLDWWMEMQGTKALDYLKSHAVTKGPRGEAEANEAILRALGQRFPDELVKLFPEQLPLVGNSYLLFDALEESRASKEDKIRLFLRAAKSQRTMDRVHAIHGLLVLQHSEAVPLLVRELEQLPRTPKEPYWLCEARHFPRLVAMSKDERAWKALLSAAKRVDLGQRMELIQAAGNDAEEQNQVLDFLAAFLGDAEVRVITFSTPKISANKPGEFEHDLFSGPCAGFIWHRLAARDLAALELAAILKIKVDDGALKQDKGWEEFRAKVAEALAARSKKNEERKQ